MRKMLEIFEHSLERQQRPKIYTVQIFMHSNKTFKTLENQYLKLIFSINIIEMFNNVMLQQLLRETTMAVFRSFSASAKKTKEERFLLNLERIAGRTDAITPENMLEICAHIQSENIAELLFVEQNYIANLFNDTELDVVVCSVEVIMIFNWLYFCNNVLFEF